MRGEFIFNYVGDNGVLRPRHTGWLNFRDSGPALDVGDGAVGYGDGQDVALGPSQSPTIMTVDRDTDGLLVTAGVQDKTTAVIEIQRCSAELRPRLQMTVKIGSGRMHLGWCAQMGEASNSWNFLCVRGTTFVAGAWTHIYGADTSQIVTGGSVPVGNFARITLDPRVGGIIMIEDMGAVMPADLDQAPSATPLPAHYPYDYHFFIGGGSFAPVFGHTPGDGGRLVASSVTLERP